MSLTLFFLSLFRLDVRPCWGVPSVRRLATAMPLARYCVCVCWSMCVFSSQCVKIFLSCRNKPGLAIRESVNVCGASYPEFPLIRSVWLRDSSSPWCVSGLSHTSLLLFIWWGGGVIVLLWNPLERWFPSQVDSTSANSCFEESNTWCLISRNIILLNNKNMLMLLLPPPSF